MIKKILYLLLLYISFFYSSVFSQNNVSQSTMAFLKIDPDARSAGLGGASVTMDNDVNALFHNPAGIAKIIGGVIAINHVQWLADINHYSLAGVLGKSGFGSFGLSLILMDNGDMARTVPDLSSQRGFRVEEPFNVNQLAVGFGYGRQLTDKFSIGGNIKYVYQDLGPADIVEQSVTKIDTLRNIKNRAGIFALDFGTIYYTGFKDLRVCMSFRNFSTSVKYSYESFQLPLVLRIGVAMDVLSLLSAQDNQSLQLHLEASNPNDFSERINVGSEYSYHNFFFLRAGFRFNRDEGRFCAGFGFSPIAFNINMQLDYAYTDFGEVFQPVHRISVAFLL